MKLLIADDEKMIREGLQDGIDWSSLGFSEVFGAENGLEALELYRCHEPEVVITDIRMPGMDGLELSRKIRELSGKTRIVVLSGYSDFQYAQQAIQSSVSEYELKPVKIKRLTAVVAKLRDAVTEDIRIEAELREAELLRKQFIEASAVQEKQPSAPSYHPTIGKAIAHMQEHYAIDLTVELLAAHVGMSPNYLSHLFKKETGVAFSEYFNKIRIGEAKKLLKGTNLMAYEITEKVGFANYKYFIQVFKKLEGVSPSEYRKGGKDES